MPTGPGASDDGIGVATMLEVAPELLGAVLTVDGIALRLTILAVPPVIALVRGMRTARTRRRSTARHSG